jgi:type II secretory pathway component PulK
MASNTLVSPAPAPGRPTERGVALLIVLVVLFIVAVLMVDITLTATTARRSARNASEAFLMDAALEGRLQIGLALLQYDAQSNDIDGGDDLWADSKHTDVEGKAPEEAAAETEGAGDGSEEPAPSSADVQVTMKIEDEERRFNLLLLLKTDSLTGEMQKEARERFVVLLDRYREDTPLDISRTRAEDLADKVIEYVNRAAPGASETGKFPLAKTGNFRLITPDELKYVEGFEDASHGLTSEGLLYEARDPRAVKEHMADPEASDEPESYPGLIKYVTLWSVGVGTDKEDPTKWPADGWDRARKINVNTAEKPVLETLFWRNPSEMTFAEKIIEYRDTVKEGADTSGSAAGGSRNDKHQLFEKMEELKKVDGLEQKVIDSNKLNDYLVLQSRVFSIDLHASKETASKQVRYVVFRHEKGFQTILREERADPQFLKDAQNPESDLPPEK